MPALLQASSLLLGVPCVLAALAATAYVLGRLLTGELEAPVERWAVPMALGLAALAHLGLLLGLAGLLRPLPVLIAAAAIHLLGISLWRRLPAAARAALHRLRGWRGVVGAAAVLPFCVLPFYPPTAFDATLYHLPFARGFVESGGVPFLRDLRFPVFPQANEMLFALVMLFAQDVAAHGVQWLMTLLTAALVWAWAREAFSGRFAGWLAAGVFLGNPLVAYLAGNAYLEAGLTLFITAALYATRRWRGTGERRWLVIAAVFAATAADSKYLGLFVLGVAGLTVLFGRLPTRSDRTARARWRSALLFSAVAAALLLPWYGRIYAWTANPLFPFFSQIFGVAGPWAPVRFHSFLAPPSRPDAMPVGREGLLGARLIDLVRLPYDLVFDRAKYNGQPPISPFYLGLLPWALLAAWRDPRQRRLLAFPAAYAFACLALPADARYLVPALPLLSIAAAGVLAPPLARSSSGRAATVCAVCFLPGWLYAGYAIHREGPLPLTAERREAYLARRQPCYAAVSYLNRTLGSGYGVWALHAENMTYYARGRFLGDWIGLGRFDRVLGGLRDPGELNDRLRWLGVGYLLLPRQGPTLPFPEDAAFRRWFEPVYSDPNASVYRLRTERGATSRPTVTFLGF